MNEINQTVKVGGEITVSGQRFVVVVAETAADMRAKGLNNVAKLMESQGRRFQMFVRKPAGRRHFFCCQYANGLICEPVAIG